MLLILGACQPQARTDSGSHLPATQAPEGIRVLEILQARYQPAAGAPSSESEAAACRAWALAAPQAEAFFSLSRPLPEGALHDFSWLPCSIEGRLQAEGREWTFEINAAGTSTWQSGDETRLLGCRDRACEPFVILMPDGGS